MYSTGFDVLIKILESLSTSKPNSIFTAPKVSRMPFSSLIVNWFIESGKNNVLMRYTMHKTMLSNILERGSSMFKLLMVTQKLSNRYRERGGVNLAVSLPHGVV